MIDHLNDHSPELQQTVAPPRVEELGPAPEGPMEMTWSENRSQEGVVAPQTGRQPIELEPAAPGTEAPMEITGSETPPSPGPTGRVEELKKGYRAPDSRWQPSLQEQQVYVQRSPEVNPEVDWRTQSSRPQRVTDTTVNHGPRSYTLDKEGNLVEATTDELTLGVRDPVLYDNLPGQRPGEDFGHLLGIDFGHVDAELGLQGGFRQTHGVNIGAWRRAEERALAAALQRQEQGLEFLVTAEAQGFSNGVPSATRIHVATPGGTVLYDSGWIANPVKP